MSLLLLVGSYLLLAAQAVLYFVAVMMAIPGAPETNAAYGLQWFLFLVGLPALCLVAAIILTIAYVSNWKHTYTWVLLPIPFALLFPIVMFW